MWRADDEQLLERLLDEAVAEALFGALVSGAPAPPLPARAGGLVAELRRLPSGEDATRAARLGDVAPLVRLVGTLALPSLSPELLHHLALLHRRVALALEAHVPDVAANAWVRSLAAWLALALAEERTYLARLASAVLGDGRAAGTLGAPEQAPLEAIAEIAERAHDSARDLGPAGRAALVALARVDDAARLAGVPDDRVRDARVSAERQRNAAIEAALSVTREALDDASARGQLAAAGPSLLLRAVQVWAWTAHDEAVEQFVVDRADMIGWELYRARSWGALRQLLEPFVPMFEELAARIERDPSRIAYAAGCAQMFVFLSELSQRSAEKLAFAERAVRVCPTHRNGRLVLASALCDEATSTMRGFGVFARRRDLSRVEAALARADAVYPQAKELPEARRMLEQVKRSRIAIEW